jgi:hypothetical protein
LFRAVNVVAYVEELQQRVVQLVGIRMLTIFALWLRDCCATKTKAIAQRFCVMLFLRSNEARAGDWHRYSPTLAWSSVLTRPDSRNAGRPNRRTVVHLCA